MVEEEIESSEKRAPICGILSVAMPFASVPVAFLAIAVFRNLYPNDEGWLSGIGFVALPVIGCFFGGMILAGIAALRDEKWRVLPWIGVILNSAPFIYGLFQ